MSELPPIPADILRLLDAEKRAPNMSPERAARLDARVLNAPLVAPSPAAPSEQAAGQVAGGAVSAPVAIGIFVAGIVLGVAGALGVQHFSSDAPDSPIEGPLPQPEPVALPVPAQVESSNVEAPPESDATVPESEEHAGPEPRTSTSRVRPAPEVVEADDSRRDLVLLEQARVALGRGQHARALAALLQHEQRYPERGAEERDALRVQAIAASGDLERARALADQFMQRYPGSLYQHVMRASLRGPENAPAEIP